MKLRIELLVKSSVEFSDQQTTGKRDLSSPFTVEDWRVAQRLPS